MPLRIQERRQDRKSWGEIGIINPNDDPGYLSHNPSGGGERIVYRFACSGENISTISWLKTDTPTRVLQEMDLEGLVEWDGVRVLASHQRFQKTVLTDGNPAVRTLRIRHLRRTLTLLQ